MRAPEGWQERFWPKVDKTESCWLWLGGLAHGYGIFYVAPHASRSAHRVAYELLVGPIPDGLQLDHLCRRRNCVNPAHLEAVTGAENTRRRDANRTHCKRGHEFNEENTYRYAGKRVCRTCRREEKRRRRSQARALGLPRPSSGRAACAECGRAHAPSPVCPPPPREYHDAPFLKKYGG